MIFMLGYTYEDLQVRTEVLFPGNSILFPILWYQLSDKTGIFGKSWALLSPVKVFVLLSHHKILELSHPSTANNSKASSHFIISSDQMPRNTTVLLAALAATAISVIDGFKFMSNWQPPKILTDVQKVEIAKTEERFGNKSEFLFVAVLMG